MIFRLIFSIFLIFLSELASQDFSVYQRLIEEGKTEEVKESLPYLSSQYPNNPFVLYLKATVNNKGEEAIEQYQMIIKNHPGSIASELAVMKVGEYLYSQGLYTQASEQLKKIPLFYPDSKNIERAVNLMKKSYLATGEQDSLDLYIAMFSKKYPQLDFINYSYYSSVIVQDEKPITEESETVPEQAILGEKSWVVQVGAFSDKKNAKVIANRLESAGYDIELIENSGDINLYLIQIVRFATIEEAVNIGEEVNNKFGLEFRIVERK